MSLRTSLQASSSITGALAASRRFATTPRYSDTPVAGPSTSTSGFGALRDLLSKSPSSPTSSPAATSPVPAPFAQSLATSTTTVIRGHLPGALPPPVDPVIDLFTNMLMKSGKKERAEATVTRILQMLRETTNQPPIPLLHRAILLASPSVRVLSMKKSLKKIDTPRGLTERQRTHQAIAWLFKAAESGRRGGLPREQRIAREILRILEGDSAVFKWLEERHKTATLARSNINAR